jgi:t-SNARE complex subunit (syntaxin)
MKKAAKDKIRLFILLAVAVVIIHFAVLRVLDFIGKLKAPITKPPKISQDIKR